MKAAILDFDGTIVDSESHWPETSKSLFEVMGLIWTPEHHQELNGHSIENCYEIMQRRHGLIMPFDEYKALVNLHAADIYHIHADVIPGARSMMDRIVEMKIDRAIASSNQRIFIDIAMRRLELEPYFSVICSAEDTPGKPKPHPDLFLLAAHKLGREPKDCVGFEDSLTGVKSVKAAGMHCVAVRGEHNGTLNFFEAGADMEIQHFDELTRERLADLLA